MKRREFLRRAAGGCAGLLTSALCAQQGSVAAPDVPWLMRLSTSSIHYQTLPIEQACARIAALGFQAIDIWSAHAGCPHLDDVAQRWAPRDSGRCWPNTNCNFVRSPCTRAAIRGMRNCWATWAAPWPCGAVPDRVLRRSSARMAEFLESLKPELELAERYQSRLAIENHGQSLLDSLDSLKAFVDLNRSPRLGVALAPYHVQALGESVEQAIAACGSQLFYFYAWQHGSGTDQLPGLGPTDFTPWLATFAQIDYRGYVNPFMHGELSPDEMSALLARSRDYLIARQPSS